MNSSDWYRLFELDCSEELEEVIKEVVATLDNYEFLKNTKMSLYSRRGWIYHEMEMVKVNYREEKNKFQKAKYKKELSLLKWMDTLAALNQLVTWAEGKLLQWQISLMKLQYKTLINLREVSYDNSYLATAQVLKIQIGIMEKELK